MKSFAFIALFAAAALAAPSQRDKRGYLSGWSSFDHHDLHAPISLDYAHGYHGLDYGLHDHDHISYVAPSHKLVSYNKVVEVPKVVEVKKVVSIPKVVSVPKIVSVSKIVEEPHHISYGSYGSHGSYGSLGSYGSHSSYGSHGWW